MKHLFLHVGVNKTGTSALQRFFKEVEDKLPEFNCIYPKCFRDEEFNASHHQLSRLLARDLFGDKERNILKKEVLESGCENVIVSSESFHALNDVECLNPLFRLFEHVSIILYVRDSLAYSLSWYQQNAQRTGASLDFSDFCFFAQPDLVLVAKKFLALKRSNIDVIIREYNREKFKNKSILYDFASILPVSLDAFSQLISNLVNTTLLQNPSICGNLLYLRRLQAATYPSKTIINDTYSFFTKISDIRKDRFQGITYIDKSQYSNFVDKFERKNNFFNRKFDMDLRLSSLDIGKISPCLETMREDFDLIESNITTSNKNEAMLYPLLSLKNRLT